MNRKAFTLIEIIIVVAIISILSVYAGVSFELISPRQLEAQTRKLAADLAWARQMAVSRDADITVDFDIANKVYLIYETSLGASRFIERKKLDVDAISVTPAPATIQFYRPGLFYYMGGGTSQNKQVNLTYKGKAKQINTYQMTGYIKWQ